MRVHYRPKPRGHSQGGARKQTVTGMAPSEAMVKILGGRRQPPPILPSQLGGSCGDPALTLHSCSKASGEQAGFPVSP